MLAAVAGRTAVERRPYRMGSRHLGGYRTMMFNRPAFGGLGTIGIGEWLLAKKRGCVDRRGEIPAARKLRIEAAVIDKNRTNAHALARLQPGDLILHLPFLLMPNFVLTLDLYCVDGSRRLYQQVDLHALRRVRRDAPERRGGLDDGVSDADSRKELRPVVDDEILKGEADDRIPSGNLLDGGKTVAADGDLAL